MKRIMLLALVASFLLVTTATAAELITNGGFETGDFTGWTWTGNTGFTGVTTTPTYVHSGTYGAQLGPVGSDGFLTQILPTVASALYFVDFWLYHDGGTPNDFTVLWNGVDVGPSLVNAAAFPYTEYSGFLVAAGNDTFTFQYRQDPAYFGLDDVSVTGTTAPIPGTVVLLGSGLLSLLGLRRVRKA
jgi:hypothetical protein